MSAHKGNKYTQARTGSTEKEYRKQAFLDAMHDPDGRMELMEMIMDDNATFGELAMTYGLSQAVFYTLLQQCPEAKQAYTDALKAKTEAKVLELYHIAGPHRVKKAVTRKDSEGNPMYRTESVEEVRGDMSALKFILTNRCPDDWKNKTDASVEIDGEGHDLSYDAFAILRQRRNAEFEQWLADREKGSNTEQGGER